MPFHYEHHHGEHLYCPFTKCEAKFRNTGNTGPIERHLNVTHKLGNRYICRVEECNYDQRLDNVRRHEQQCFPKNGIPAPTAKTGDVKTFETLQYFEDKWRVYKGKKEVRILDLPPPNYDAPIPKADKDENEGKDSGAQPEVLPEGQFIYHIVIDPSSQPIYLTEPESGAVFLPAANNEEFPDLLS